MISNAVIACLVIVSIAAAIAIGLIIYGSLKADKKEAEEAEQGEGTNGR